MEPGESDEDALRRELIEEAGLVVRVGQLVGSVLRAAPGGRAFEIFDYECTVEGGELRPGDDASDARFVTLDEYLTLPVVDGLTPTLTSWGVLARCGTS